MEQDYMIDFEKFQSDFRKTEVSGEEVGEVVMKMAGYFGRYNVRLSNALRAYSLKRAEFQNQVDVGSGKPMSSSKAETLADATEEAATYQLAKVHIQNIEQYLNALKSLQKGVLQEYAHSGA